MSLQHRVVWTQGLFLQPHHFQQESRFLQQQTDRRIRAVHSLAWGFNSLVLDESQLAQGAIALERASGVFADGTPFELSAQAGNLPPPWPVGADMQDEVVVLAVPLAQPGATEVDFGDGSAPGQVRYDAVDVAVRDHTNAADDPEALQLAVPRFRLLRAREAREAYSVLGVARVQKRRADLQVLLDRSYIAPQSRIDASAQLSVSTTLLQGLVQQRARSLAAQMGQLGQGVSEVADFLMLQLLNRYQPLLQQFAAAPSVHPQQLHTVLLQLAGEMATFSSSARCPPDYPLYVHDDLTSVFAPLLHDLREMLSSVLQRHAQQLEWVDRGHGVCTAVVTDAELLRNAGFVLAVRCPLPADQVRQQFPDKSKLGPTDRIRDLVNLQLPGIALRSLAVAPRQLPYHAGSHYFEIERHGELWAQFQRTGALALHVAGDFPQLELELWAVRQS